MTGRHGPLRLHLRLREPARRAEAWRLLSLLLAEPPLPGAEPALLTAEVPDGRRAVDVLIELAWSDIDLDAFAFGQAAPGRPDPLAAAASPPSAAPAA